MKSLLVVMMLGAVAAIAAAQPAERPALAVDVIAPNGELDAAQVLDAIAHELAVGVISPSDSIRAPLGTLRVIASGDAVRVVYEPPGHTAVERSLVLPRLPDDRVRLVTYVASNMIRDQAGELLAQLAPPPAPPNVPAITQLPPMPPPPTLVGRHKSGWAAFGLSLAGTLVSVPFFAEAIHNSGKDIWMAWASIGGAALVVGPSAGHYYATRSLGWMIVPRFVGAALIAGSISLVYYGARSCLDTEQLCSNGLFIAVEAASVAGEVLLAGGALGDLIAAPLAARSYNRTHAWVPSATVAPIVVPRGGGLGLAGTF